jgi:hypothetical protein
MVVGRQRTLVSPKTVRLTGKKIKLGHRRCAVAPGTALAALLATPAAVGVTDIAGCDDTQMFVTRVGPDRNRGIAGWEYKVGNAAPSFGAGDPSGRLHSGAQVLWFWCTRASACERTLTVQDQRQGVTVRLHVLAEDDNGHGQAVAGAAVHVGASVQTADAHGNLTVAETATREPVYATKSGLVRSFPIEIGGSP